MAGLTYRRIRVTRGPQSLLERCGIETGRCYSGPVRDLGKSPGLRGTGRRNRGRPRRRGDAWIPVADRRAPPHPFRRRRARARIRIRQAGGGRCAVRRESPAAISNRLVHGATGDRGRHPLAVIALTDRLDGRPFDSRDLAAARVLASTAAAAQTRERLRERVGAHEGGDGGLRHGTLQPALRRNADHGGDRTRQASAAGSGDPPRRHRRLQAG